MDEKVSTCSFCGSSPDMNNGEILIEGKSSTICSTCVDKCTDALLNIRVKDSESNSDKDSEIKRMRPSEIRAILDEHIVGQEEAKRTLSIAVSNHYKLLNHRENKKDGDIDIEKSNVLLVGPTGTGKTLFAKQIAKILNVPFAMADATSLTEAGYVGEDVESMLKSLLKDADGDVELAEKGIIFVDEIDKLSRKGENLSLTRDVSGEGVQQALLKIIEGTVSNVPTSGGRKHPGAATVEIDTSGILFILGGSFEGIEEVISERVKSGEASIGFGANIESKKDVKFNDFILDIRQEDLRKFGMLPELLGRIPVISPLEELSEEMLVKILTEPKNAIVKQYQELFNVDDIDLVFEADSIKAIANLAIERKVGARSLRTIMESTLKEAMYDAPDIEDLSEVIITEAVVRGEDSPKYVLQEKIVNEN